MRHLLRVYTESDECVCWVAEATVRELNLPGLSQDERLELAEWLEVFFILEEQGVVSQRAKQLRRQFPSPAISNADVSIAATTHVLDAFLFTHNECDFPSFTKRLCLDPNAPIVSFRDASPPLWDADQRPRELQLLWRLSERNWPLP